MSEAGEISVEHPEFKFRTLGRAGRVGLSHQILSAFSHQILSA
jgi:hypothetical protein